MSDTILLEAQSMWYKKKIQAFPGKIVITESRFAFIKEEVVVEGAGLLGKFLSKSKENLKGGILLDAAIDSVTFSKGKSMGKSWMLEVHKGEEDFRFMVDNKIMDEMKSVIKLN